MFETLFKEARTVQRYLAAPLLRLRLCYLDHCAARGLADRTIRDVARHQLQAVQLLPLQEPGPIPVAEVEAAGQRWAAGRKVEQGGKRQRAFVTGTLRCLRFSGRLDATDPEPTPHAERLAAFADSLLRERGLSAESVRNYCSRAREFLRRHCGEKPSLADITVADVDRALADKASQEVARKTLAAYASALRAFFRYAEDCGWCRPGLAAAIPLPRQYSLQTLPAGPAWEDVQRLLAATAGDRPADVRDQAILLLLAVYGLRSGAVRGLRLDDLDWVAETMCVRCPKPGRTHLYPLSRTVGDAILRYVRGVRPASLHREVFLSLQAPARPLSTAGLWRVVGPRLRRLGIDSQRSGPHALRHACAQRLLDTGFSLKQIGDCLGHRHPDSTAVYAKTGLGALREVAAFDWEGVL